MKILYVVNEAKFFISHRLRIGQEALARGDQVIVVSGMQTGEEALADYGFEHIGVPMTRSGLDLLEELRTFRALRRVYRREQPNLVHHVTIKPVLYGSFAARSVNVPAVVNAVPGMGFVFTRRGVLASIRRACVNLGLPGGIRTPSSEGDFSKQRRHERFHCACGRKTRTIGIDTWIGG